MPEEQRRKFFSNMASDAALNITDNLGVYKLSAFRNIHHTPLSLRL